MDEKPRAESQAGSCTAVGNTSLLRLATPCKSGSEHPSANLFGKQTLGRSLGVVKQIASFGAGEGLARGLNWGTMALLPLFLSNTEEYGRVGLLVSLEMLISNISLMGIDRAVLRFYARDELPGTLLKSVLAIWAAAAWIPLAAVTALYLGGRETFFGIPLAPHLFLLSAVAAIFNLNVLCVRIGRAKRDLAVFLRFRLCYVGLKFVCVLLMAHAIGHSLSYVVGVALSALVMLILIIPFLKQRVDGRADRAVVGQLLSFGWPFVFIMISGNIFDYFSRFFLEAYNTTKDVGVFTFAFTLGSGLFVFFAALASYFEPRIYGHADDKPRCEKWLMLYTNACLVLASAGGAFLLLLYPYLSPHLSPDYARALPVISMIMGAVLLQPLYLQGSYRLSAHKNTGQLAGATFFAAGLSLALNFLLIPRFGIWGAALALYFSYFILTVCILTVSLRMARIPWRQPYSGPTCAISTLGSLPPLVYAHRPELVSISLLLVCLASSGLLIKMFMTGGAQST